MKQSLKNRILNYIRRNFPAKIASGEIEKLAQGIGRTGSNATRRLRELQNDGLIEVSYGNKNHAFYQAIPPKERIKYISDEGKEIIIYKY